ncbi:MAG: DUF935 domain-containing protein [Chromatiales bacterium]|nr:DUF935 domain-containing protein [Gammaproteobacteria bacterium]
MVNILDQFGKLLRRRDIDLKETQTAHLGQLQQEYATHPSNGLTPYKLRQVLEDAEQGDITAQHSLFLDMEEKDGHIFAEMSKRRRALMNLPWSVEPPRNADASEKRMAEEANEWLQEIPDIEDVILDAMDAVGHGFACLEMEWALNQKIWLPADIEHRPQSWFKLDRETRSELRLRDQSMEGEKLEPFTWIVHTHRAKPGYISRAGLHRVLAWPYLFKNYSVRDLAEFLEIYGLPVKLGRYPNGATNNEKSTLMRAVVGLGHNAAGIIPDGMAIDFLQAAEGGSDPFDAMIDWCERTQSKAILGATLTSGTGSGTNTNALGNIHNEVRKDLRDSDAKQIEGTLGRDLIYPLLAANGRLNDPRRCPRFKFDIREPEDLKMLSEALPKLVEVGMDIPQKWAHEKSGIPEPEEGEAVLQVAPVSQPAALRVAALKAAPAEPDVVDQYVGQLQEATTPAIGQMLDQVKQLLDEVESLEEFQDRLLEIYGHMEPDDLAEVMQLGFAAADLAGRYEVQEGQ